MTKQQRRTEVFVSGDTDNDHFLLRDMVRIAIFNAGMYPINEHNKQTPYDSAFMEKTYEALLNADVFVGVYGLTYGEIPPKGAAWPKGIADGKSSIWSYEYLWARERKLPILIFKYAPAKHDYRTVTLDVSEEMEERTTEFETFMSLLLQENVVEYFDDPLQLRGKMTNKLYQYKFQYLENSVDIEEKITNAVFRALELFHVPREKLASPEENERGLETLSCTPSFRMPVSRNPEFTSDVFVIMPFRESFDGVYKTIERVCKELGLIVKRGDDFTSDEFIMTQVWDGLNNTRLIIADCTGQNANVYYELGIAHVLGKPTIAITQNLKSEPLPFDIAGRHAISYTNDVNGSHSLENALRKRIAGMLNSPTRKTDRSDT